ncbi:hypothetical protein QFC21_005110 [Naganishia friedmannii]|uniref:Uncharacterized protein n=1 Tax=Naganishia friedmannii TaxID=89922 RepID=A0ACC2VCX6_9TREE|nr:hypothetical protein QFC21_005110 [Naganishia friedmannii]
MATPENSPAREAYEKRYGKKQLTRMVAEWVEQRANADWFDKHTRACAGCGTRLRPADPYHHYRTPGSSCFEKLFDADEIARFEREVVGDPAALEGGFGDEDFAFGMGVEVDGWVGDVFPLQGNGGWW